jgi:hypothetical protein
MAGVTEAAFESDDLDELRDCYLGGGCHALALAVAERTGWDLAVVWAAKGRRTEIAHAMVVVPGDEELYLDVGGIRGLPEILEDLQIDPDEEDAILEGPVGPERIHALTRGRHAHRRFCDIGPELADHAAATADRLVAAVTEQSTPDCAFRP